jgi:hypothetical protein
MVADREGSITSMGVILGICAGIAFAIGRKAQRYINGEKEAQKGLFALDRPPKQKVYPDKRIANRRESQVGERRGSLTVGEDQLWIARGEQTPMMDETFSKGWRNQLKLIGNQPEAMLEKGLKRMR